MGLILTCHQFIKFSILRQLQNLAELLMSRLMLVTLGHSSSDSLKVVDSAIV